LTKGILDKVGTGNPLAISAYEFNSTAEEFYREDLKRRHIAEGFQMLRLDFAKIDSWQSWRSGKYNKTLWKILKGRGAEEYLRINKKDVLNGDASVTVLKTLLHLMLLTIHQNMEQADHLIKGK
jgi:hypothetical protein